MNEVENFVPTQVFVYGTLKKGYHNHGILKDSKLLGEAHTEASNFEMYSLGGFPAVTMDGKNRIIGEVYEVNTKHTMGRLDALEGHPRWYQRIKVRTSLGEAWIYIMPSSRLCYEGQPKPPIVAEGFWSKL